MHPFTSRLRRPALAVAGLAAAGGVAGAGLSLAQGGSGPRLQHVPTANPRAAGYSPASRLSVQLQQMTWAQGSNALENPRGLVTNFGFENDVPSPDDPTVPQMIPVAANPDTEAQKTEPDKNTYLRLSGQHGPDANYDYGTHFVYQGHEGAATLNGEKAGYITRVNLDADARHRVTLLATRDTAGRRISTIDGSTWDPYSGRLLFTAENPSAPTYAATPDYPSKVEDVSGALGRGGYEGIQDDSDGNIWIVEDVGGSVKAGTTAAKQPNSYLYRYVPRHPGDLHHGNLQVLQVRNRDGHPITWDSQMQVNAPDQVLLHSYGHSLATRWVTIHRTSVDGTTPFDANALAKAKGATPFKRPENGLFRPGTQFRQFFFSETGDTSATSEENARAGGWGGVQRLEQSSPSANRGQLSLFYSGDKRHTGFDNVAWLSGSKVTFVEDAGDTLHGQRNALDSGWVLDTHVDYSDGIDEPLRWLAQGRDAAATIDAEGAGFGKNDGDNELTGVHVSDGDARIKGILGTKTPTLWRGGWRWFYTDQHGDNRLWEVIPSRGSSAGSR